MHFRHISAKILPKILKLFHYTFLAVRGNIWLGGGWGSWALPWLRRCFRAVSMPIG